MRSVILGVISSVVLSLVLAILGGNATQCPSSTVAWRWRTRFRTWTEYTIHVPPRSDPGDSMEITVRRHLPAALGDTYAAPGAPHPRYSGPDADGGYPVRYISITAAGVPFRSFWGYRASDGLNSAPSGTVAVTTGGDWLPIAFPSAAKRATRVLPYRPLWGGLAANALVHAAAWVALFSILAGLRGWRRARRGLCGVCSYDRRGLAGGAPCPECGTAP